jgi:hypothetical protein
MFEVTIRITMKVTSWATTSVTPEVMPTVIPGVTFSVTTRVTFAVLPRVTSGTQRSCNLQSAIVPLRQLQILSGRTRLRRRDVPDISARADDQDRDRAPGIPVRNRGAPRISPSFSFGFVAWERPGAPNFPPARRLAEVVRRRHALMPRQSSTKVIPGFPASVLILLLRAGQRLIHSRPAFVDFE